jgi:integrase
LPDIVRFRAFSGASIRNGLLADNGRNPCICRLSRVNQLAHPAGIEPATIGLEAPLSPSVYAAWQTLHAGCMHVFTAISCHFLHTYAMRTLVRIKKWDSQPRYKFTANYRQGGKRIVRYFADEKGAKAFAAEKQIELLNEGRRNGEITAGERRAMMVAREKGISLKDAIEHYLAHVESLSHSATIETAIEEFLSIRQAEGKAKAHLIDLKHRLNRFAREFGPRLAASISTKEIDGWLHGLPVAPQTRVNFRRVIHNFFTFCVARGYCTGNPVTQASKPKVPPKAIGILTVEQSEALLQACPGVILPAVAIGLFAGLRREEIARLDWRSIDLGRGFIEVTAAKSKTAQRRLVSIPENLHAWLAPCRAISGSVMPPAITYRRKFLKALKVAGIESWPANALRHSFASYHLAEHQDAAKTALQLGHAESRTLFAHYRELVKPEEAKAFWQIFPS